MHWEQTGRRPCPFPRRSRRPRSSGCARTASPRRPRARPARTRRGWRQRRAPPTEVSAAPTASPPTEVSDVPPTTEQQRRRHRETRDQRGPAGPSPRPRHRGDPRRRRRDRRRRGAAPAATAAPRRRRARGSRPAAPAAPRRAQGVPVDLGLARGALIIALAAGGYFVGHAGGKKARLRDGAISVQNATVDIPSGWHEISAPKVPEPAAPAGGRDVSRGLERDGHGPCEPEVPVAPPERRDRPRGRAGQDVLQPASAHRQDRPAPGLADVRASASPRPASRSTRSSTSRRERARRRWRSCYSKTGSVSHLLDCEKAASGISISGAKLYDLLPSKTYASGLDSALSALSKTKNVPYQTLKSAKTPSAQAKAARQIATAYSVVATDVKKLKPTPYAQPENQKIYKAIGDRRRHLADARLGRRRQELVAILRRIEKGRRPPRPGFPARFPS